MGRDRPQHDRRVAAGGGAVPMSDLRVLHLIPSLGGGGAERQIAYLARGLVASGVDVHVGYLREGSNFERLAASGATLHPIASRGNYDALLVARIVRLIRR